MDTTPKQVNLPYFPELEQAVLGAILLDNTAMPRISTRIFAEVFGVEKHKIVYSAAMQLYKDNRPIDILTITEKIKEIGKLEQIGGAYYLVELTNRVASAANLEYHAQILLQKWVKRQVISVSWEAFNKAQDDTNDPLTMLSDLQVQMMQAAAFLTVGAGKRTPELIDDILNAIEEGVSPKKYHHIGIGSLDRLMGGLLETELCIIAGRPGSGKTTLAISMMANLAQFNVPCAFFTYEMPTSELMLKFVSNLGEVDSEAFNRGLNEFEKTCAFAAGHKLKRLPLYLEDGGGMDAIALRSRIVTMVQQFGIKVVFVDYLQLMPYVQGQERKSTHDALGETARLLKSIAKETGVCIVAMSQLSKETEKNRLAKPQLANLRDSGKLEDNADRVLFVWRPIYHGFDTVDYKGGEINTVGKACIIQAKFRHGNIGEAWTKAELQYSKFSTLENAFERIEDPFWEEISSTQSPNAGLDTPF